MIKFIFFTTIYAFVSFAIIRILKISMFQRNWAYPLLLASFPLFYMFFALWINDKTELKNEFFGGLLFFIIAIIYVRYRKPWVEPLLIAGFFLHAAYDIFHNLFFINMGVPLWWPEFCGTVDLFIGFYLLFLYKKNKTINPET